jgi:hypothetical protein
MMPEIWDNVDRVEIRQHRWYAVVTGFRNDAVVHTLFLGVTPGDGLAQFDDYDDYEENI